MPKNKYQNLHAHTTVSDGKLTYKQTLDICQKHNIGIVAFTDHDSLPSKKTIKELRNLSFHDVKWVAGIEISSGLPKELGGKPTSDFHIVGLFINPFDKKLKQYCKKIQAARIEKMERMVKNLKQLGFKINVDDCFSESKGESINRPHIIAALLRKLENITLIENLKNKMEKASRQNPILKQKYDKMIKAGKKRYPYTLFLDDTAYIKDIFVDYLYGLELDKTVEIIRNAGGRAILAHWTFCKRKISIGWVEKLLREKRLDGVEVVYNPKVRMTEKEILSDMKKLRELAEKYNALQSGGANSHCEEDIINFSESKEFAEKTINFVENILKKTNLDPQWSSLEKT